MAPAAVRGAIIGAAPSCVKGLRNPTPPISIPGKRLARISFVDRANEATLSDFADDDGDPRVDTARLSRATPARRFRVRYVAGDRLERDDLLLRQERRRHTSWNLRYCRRPSADPG